MGMGAAAHGAAAPQAEVELSEVRDRSVGAGWRSVAAIGVPALVMLVAASVIANRWPLWRDEVATLSFATLRVADLFPALTHVDAVLGPFYLVAHVTQQVLPGTLGLRLPSILAATISTVAVGMLARRWWGTWPALVAGLAFALNPLALTMAATARPYALATCFVALAALALDHAVRTRRVWAWIAYAAALALAGLFQLMALVAVAALVVLAVGSWRRFAAWAIATAGALVVVLPLALAGFSQRSQVAWIPRPDARSAIGSLASVLDFQGDGRLGWPNALTLGIVALVAAASLLLLRRPRADRASALRQTWFGILLFGAPWALLLAVSLVATPYLRTTYLAPSSVGLALLLAAGAARGIELLAGPSSGRRRGAGATLIAASLIPLLVGAAASAVVIAKPWRIDDFPGLAARLQEVAHEGDGLIVVQQYNEVGVAASLARATGDLGYLTELQQQLPRGAQPEFGVRTVASSPPFATIAGSPGEGTYWIAYTNGALSDDEFAELANELGCSNSPVLEDTESFGLMRLSRAECE